MCFKILIVSAIAACLISCETKLIGCEKVAKVICVEPTVVGGDPTCTMQLSGGAKITQAQYIAEGDAICVFNNCYVNGGNNSNPCLVYKRCGCIPGCELKAEIEP
jgi:hypothetical protein